MASVSELLGISAQTHQPVRCAFKSEGRHGTACVCRGSGRVMACPKCAGTGWDPRWQKPCSGCGGVGAYAASPAVNR